MILPLALTLALALALALDLDLDWIKARARARDGFGLACFQRQIAGLVSSQVCGATTSARFPERGLLPFEPIKAGGTRQFDGGGNPFFGYLNRSFCC